MIEGLRVFPAYQDARRRKAVVSDCVTCKREQTMTTRQAIGCGYEPALADAQAWAVSNNHCTNEFEAKASFKNSLKEVTGQDGKLDSNHLAAVLENFYKKHIARQSEQLKAA